MCVFFVFLFFVFFNTHSLHFLQQTTRKTHHRDKKTRIEKLENPFKLTNFLNKSILISIDDNFLIVVLLSYINFTAWLDPPLIYEPSPPPPYPSLYIPG